jgi:hypothetical protein
VVKITGLRVIHPIINRPPRMYRILFNRGCWCNSGAKEKLKETKFKGVG